jgi:hypothetical protein
MFNVANHSRATYTIGDALTLLQIGQVAQPYSWNSTMMTGSGNLATETATLQGVGTANLAG